VQIKVELIQAFGIAKRMERLDVSPLWLSWNAMRRHVKALHMLPRQFFGH